VIDTGEGPGKGKTTMSGGRKPSGAWIARAATFVIANAGDETLEINSPCSVAKSGYVLSNEP